MPSKVMQAATNVAKLLGMSAEQIGLGIGPATKAGKLPYINTTQTAKDAFNASQSSADKAMQFSAAQAAQMMAFQKAMMENQQAFNSAQARLQRNWQERMRATAYQATVKDMIAAGISPIMAAQLGATSVGSGATATSGMAQGAMGTSAQAYMQQQEVPQLIRAAGYLFDSANRAAEHMPMPTSAELKGTLNEWLKNQANAIKGKFAFDTKKVQSNITPASVRGR